MGKEIECIICIGVPASGKSTWSKEYIHKNPKFVRINRDDFRFMLKDQPMCEPKIEDAITDMFYMAIDIALAKKLSIIIDNTNLKKRYIDSFVSYVEHRADVKFMVFDISLEKALERDKNREKSVGEGVITKMYKDYKDLMDGFSYSDQRKKVYIYKDPEMIEGLPSIVVFDIDGTLSHVNGKRDYFDWYKVDRDDIDGVVLKAYQRHKNAGDRIFIVTGRSEEARPKTEEWLDFHGITYENLLMRKADDFRRDNIVKGEIYNHYIKGKYNVEVVYDDRQQVVDMWRSLGLKVFQVSKGEH
jgi:predicted kinase